MKPKSKILIIAGSDSSGGAGIQADVKTVTSLGSYAMTAITAITSQNTTGVISIGFIGKIDFTPVVFCDVTAVIAVIAYEPRAVTVFISACMPAPPEESDPAIIKIFDLGFNILLIF